MINPRAAAARAVARVFAGGEALDVPLQDAADGVSVRDHALFKQLCYGSLRHYHQYSGFLRQCLTSPLKQRDADVQALMLIGLLQLFEMRTPDHAAISSSVEACRALGKPWATRLVNGVLRRCLRESDTLRAQLREHEGMDHPAWLVKALRSDWPDHCAELIATNNAPPPMSLRVNKARTDRDAYLDQLASLGIGAQPGALAKQSICLDRPLDVNELPGFFQGEVSVQDEAAQLAAHLLAPVQGQRVLDACAAPGGKACHILETHRDIAELVAMDSDPQRLSRVAQNLERLSLEATLLCADACVPEPSLGEFDRILVDAPCSGTGVIRRHPDIKVLRRSEDIAGFAKQQQAILSGLWPRLKPGGRLLYVTCSVLRQENTDVIERFLSETADASTVAIESSWGVQAGLGRQLLSGTHGADGLFYAAVEKTR
ncbi:MAG: 16S rRNA (cytosine(967)-C(5))-methyltransferase RsmB [Pseudomonadota bacterium]